MAKKQKTVEQYQKEVESNRDKLLRSEKALDNAVVNFKQNAARLAESEAKLNCAKEHANANATV